MIKNGKKRFAYAIGMFPNPKNKKAAYLDGCILAALGLKKMQQVVDHQDSPQIRGMINNISYLLKVEEL